MFNEQYDDIRTMISSAQSNILKIVGPMNAVNPSVGGTGLSPEQLHVAIATVAAEVHNVAFALGALVDVLDQNGTVSNRAD